MIYSGKRRKAGQVAAQHADQLALLSGGCFNRRFQLALAQQLVQPQAQRRGGINVIIISRSTE